MRHYVERAVTHVHTLKQRAGKHRAGKQRAGIPVAAAIFAAILAPATGASADPSLSLELNRASITERGCMLTFVASNRTQHAISGVAYEFVLFNTDGLVDKMTAFDFGALPQEKTVVRQFELAGTQCPDIGQILINGAARCDLADPHSGSEGLCVGDLALASRTDITFIK